MSTRCTTAGYNRKRDTEAESYGDLKYAAECAHAELFTQPIGGRECECAYSCDTREYVEEDTSRFGHALPEDTRSSVLEVEFPLGDRFWSNNVAGSMPVPG